MAKPKLRMVANEPSPMAHRAEAITVEQVRALVEAGEPHALLDVLVTPEVAKLLLTYNHPGETNRRITRTGVNLAAAALRTGKWENTGEPVIVSDERLLNDGQHRLVAIVEAGIPARMDLRFGVPRRAFAATNSGGKREAAHALLLHGVASPRHIASIARLALAYEMGLPGAARQRISNQQIVEAYERWPDIPGVLRYTNHLPMFIRNASVETLAFFALRTANPPAVEDFFGVLQTGEGRADNPAHRYREALLAMKGGKDSGTRAVALALGIIAWNAWRKPPHKLSTLAWKPKQPFPEVDGLTL